MDFTISWTTPLTSTERRRLRCWLQRAVERYPGLIEHRRGVLIVRDDNLDAAHSFAALTMAVVGRDPLAYTLVEREGLARVATAA